MIGRLADAGAVEVLPTGAVRAARDLDTELFAGAVAEGQASRKWHLEGRLEMMRSYAETPGCRRQFLLRHLGEPYEGPCGACDRCEAAVRAAAEESADSDATGAPAASRSTPSDSPSPADVPFPIDSWVVHRDWGKGVMREVQNGRLVVVFEREGEKTIAIDHVLANGLLQRAYEAAQKSKSA